MARLLFAKDIRGLHNNNDIVAPVMSGTAPVVTSITSSTATLAWSAATDNVAVTVYTLYDATPGNGGGTSAPTVIDTTIPSVRTYNLTGLAPGQDNIIWITASDAAGNESSPTVVTITTSAAVDTTAPTVPDNLVLSAVQTSQVAFSWDASSDDLSGVDHYQVLDGGVLVVSTPDNVPSITISGLAAGSSHTYTVKAVDAAGNVSAASSGTTGTLSVTTLTVGTNVSVRGSATAKTTAGANPSVVIPSNVRTGDLMLMWASTANGETQAAPSGWSVVTSPITNVNVEASLLKRTAAGTAGQLSTDAGTTVTLALTGGSQKNELYLVAFYGMDATTPLDVVTTASESTSTATHTVPAATSSANQCAQIAAIAYRDGTTATTTITPPSGWTSPAGLNATGGTNSNGIYVAVNPTPVATGAHSGSTLVADQPTSHAVMWDVCIAPSLAASDTTAPGQVAALNATTVTAISVGLAWNAQTDPSGVSYNLYWNDPANNPGNLTANVVYQTNIPGTAITVGGLTPSTTYAFAVSAVDGAQNEGAKSGTIRPVTQSSGGGSSTGILYGIQATGSSAAQTRLGDRSAANGWISSSGGVLVDSSGNSINVGQTRCYYPPGAFPTAFSASYTAGNFGTNVHKRAEICWKGNSGFQNFQDVANGGADIAYCRFVNSIPSGWEVPMTFHHEPNGDFNTTNNTPAQYKAAQMRLGALLENRAMPAGQPAKNASAAAVNLAPNTLVYNEICFTAPRTSTDSHWASVKDAIPLASQMDALAKLNVDAYQNPPPPISGSTYPTGATVLGYFLDNILHAYGYDAAGHGWTIGEWMAPARDGDTSHAGQTAAINEYLTYCENRTVPSGWGPAGGQPYCIRMWEDKNSISDAGAQFNQTAYAGAKAAFVAHALGVHARV